MDTRLHLILEAVQYKTVWKAHARRIRRAFREVTGLDFQQRVITARVSAVMGSSAGFYNHAMELAGDNRSKEQKLLTLIHELSHRLLGGYALDATHLGLYREVIDSDDVFQEMEHRTIYLFLLDVVERALGRQWIEACTEYETVNLADPEGPHARAWEWAMSMTYAERQKRLKQLIKKGFSREHWSEVKIPKTF
jgi:hypothetical protein